MNHIRTFILCSSLLLVVWLTASYASYSTQLDHTGPSVKPTVSSQNTHETPATTPNHTNQQDLKNSPQQETVSTSFTKFE